MILGVGTKLGPYEVVAPLGAGGMGEVYKARDTRLDRLVALKLIAADVAGDPDRLARFEREARAASALNHPAIVTIYDVGVADAQPWISMELVAGQTLRQLLAGGALPLRRALTIAAQLADGLAKAHEAGIVHRDLKPENVMVTDDGFAKILDFGLARLTNEEGHPETVTRPGNTRPGTVLGTLAYMSPEQAGGAVVDFRSDQFSFGAVLYETLTGSRAFERPSSVDTLSAVLRDDPPPIAEANVTIPPPVRWIVERTLEKRAADRYSATRDLARDLAQARDHLSEMSTTVPVSAGDARSPVDVRWRERIAWILAAGLAFAVAGLLLARPPRSTSSAMPAATLRFPLPAPDNTRVYRDNQPAFEISPDGRRLVLVAVDSDGRRDLWLRALDSLSWQKLAGTEGALDPFWSPDGSEIGFFTADKLKSVPASGGDVRTVCDARGAVGGAWSREGTILFSLQNALQRVPASGGVPAAATPSTGFWPHFLPDGNHYVSFDIVSDTRGIYLAALDSAERHLLKRLEITTVSVLGFTEPNWLLYVQSGTLIAQRLDLEKRVLSEQVIRVAENVDVNPPSTSFSVSRNGVLVYWTGGRTTMELKWAGRDGLPIGNAVARGAFTNFQISADGRSLLTDRIDTSPASIWLFDLQRGGNTRLTFDYYANNPVPSPDGSRFVFGSARDSPPNVYLTTIGSATEDERLTRSDLVDFPLDWSLDGQTVVFFRNDPKTGPDIWILPMVGDRTPMPIVNTPFTEWEAAVSPDGRWMAYSSNESGRSEVYVLRFPNGGDRRPISTGGGYLPRWRADGRELYYRDKQRILAVPVTSGTSGDSFKAGAPTVLFEVPTMVGELEHQGFAVAPDGRFLLNTVVERTSPPLTVVSDWRLGLVR